MPTGSTSGTTTSAFAAAEHRRRSHCERLLSRDERRRFLRDIVPVHLRCLPRAKHTVAQGGPRTPVPMGIHSPLVIARIDGLVRPRYPRSNLWTVKGRVASTAPPRTVSLVEETRSSSMCSQCRGLPFAKTWPLHDRDAPDPRSMIHMPATPRKLAKGWRRLPASAKSDPWFDDAFRHGDRRRRCRPEIGDDGGSEPCRMQLPSSQCEAD
jgi:hypothetical protein